MKKILIVDDEPEFSKRRFDAAGYTAFTAANGIDGIETARRVKPDLILLDLVMPGKDGLAVLRELKGDEDLARIPVVILTGKGDLDYLFQGERGGAIDYFIKPCEWQELLKFIEKYLVIAG